MYLKKNCKEKYGLTSKIILDCANVKHNFYHPEILDSIHRIKALCMQFNHYSVYLILILIYYNDNY